jgi:hypothetical protein
VRDGAPVQFVPRASLPANYVRYNLVFSGVASFLGLIEFLLYRRKIKNEKEVKVWKEKT